jgi:dipeptidyl aminopeptidase/acylaminoacyl peptidase
MHSESIKRGVSIFAAVILACGLVVNVGGASPSSAAAGATDLSVLYEIPPADLAALVAQTKAEWALRNHDAVGWTPEASGAYLDCQVKVFSHLIDGDNDGAVDDRHYVAVRYPRNFAADKKFPVLLINHGGTNGVNLNKLEDFDNGLPDTCVKDNFFIILPSYRGESLDARVLDPAHADWLFHSGGQESTLDYDVDDVITALNAVLKKIKQTDKTRIAAYGTSRGASVTLLLDARDTRIKRTVDMFGGADMMLTEAPLEAAGCGGAAGNPILNLLLDVVICPYLAGDLTVDEARLALVRRSAVYFADGLFKLQIHHGTADTTVPIAHSYSLSASLEALGTTPPFYQFYVYEGGLHSVTSLHDDIAGFSAGDQGVRVEPFLCDLLTP